LADRHFARAMRRKTQWAGFGDVTGTANLPTMVTVAANASVIISQGLIVANSAGLVDEEVTITRVIGDISVAVAADGALSRWTLALGLAVSRLEAITAGVASLPSAEDDPDFEWLYYTVLQGINPQNTLRDGPLSGLHVRFDVKGQRVVRTGYSVVWIAEAQTTAVQVGVGGRALVKLP